MVELTPTPVLAPQKHANVKLATWLSIVPGLGQLYNRQLRKAVTFFALVAGLFVVTLNIPGVTGLLLAQWMPRSSLIWLSIQMFSVLLFMTTFFLALLGWYDAMHDARRTAQERNGERQPGGRWWLFHR